MKFGFSRNDPAWRKIMASFEETLEESEAYNAYLEEGIPLSELGLPKPRLLDPKDYQTAYAEHVRPQEFEKGDLTLLWKGYKPHQGFVYDEISVDPLTYRERTPFGAFEKPFPYLALEENGATWMSVTPHEINTMRKPLNAMRGKCLVLGLGLGYFAYEALRKEEVQELLLVDNDPRIIALFKERIAPFFPTSKPWSIEEGDAFAALERAKDFDSVFVDIWHMPDDALPLYLRAISYEEKATHTHFEHWIEHSVLALIRRGLLILVDEELENGENDENYQVAETDSDRLINALHFALKGKTVKSIRDLRGILSDSGLKEIAKRLRF